MADAKKKLNPKTNKLSSNKSNNDDALRDNLNEINVEEIDYNELNQEDMPDIDKIRLTQEVDLDNTNKNNEEEKSQKQINDKSDLKSIAKLKKESTKEQEMFKDIIKDVQNMEGENVKDYFNDRLSGENSKKFLNNLNKYLKSSAFEQKCEKLSNLHKVEKNKIAETFSQKAIATIADCMGVAVEVTYCATMFLINMITSVLKAAVGIICSIANRLLGFLSLGYTRTLA